MKKMIAALALVCLCLSVLAGSALAGAPIPGVATKEWNVLKIVNANRIAEGLNCLSLFSSIQTATDIRSNELIELFDHTRPDGTACFTALDECGIDYTAAGENIAAGQSTAEMVMNSWMNSAGHRANILSEDYTHIGIGYVKSDVGYTHYWTQLFVGCNYEEVTGISLSRESVEAGVGTKLSDMDITITEANTVYGSCYLPLIDEMCPGYDAKKAGEQVLTINYGGQSATLTVVLTEKKSTPKPTAKPTARPTAKPTAKPTAAPTAVPTPGPEPYVGMPIDDGDLSYEVTAPGEVSFTGVNKSVASVTIPDTIRYNGGELAVTSIADKAFMKDKKLKTVCIGDNVETIGSSAFKSCAKLTTVKGGASVRTIGANAFAGCKALKKFPVMNELESIGNNAFKGCVKLAKFTLGEKVSSIGKNAFNGCKALKTLTVKTEKLTNDNVGKAAFKGINSKATFKCPKTVKKEYKKLFVKKGAPKKSKFK